MLTFGSLFAGIGGFDLGLERAGMTCAWQVEREPYAVRVLEKHWPNVRRWGDVRTFPPDESGWADVDLICAGVPCQPISIAGKQKGKADERWLWGEFLRVVADIEPRMFLAENPTAILSHDGGSTFAGIVAAVRAARYHIEWATITARSVGAPHKRARTFVLGWQPASLGAVQLRKFCVHDSSCTRSRLRMSGDRRLGGEPIPNSDHLADTNCKRSQGAVLEHASEGLLRSCSGARGNKNSGLSETARDWWATEPDVGRVAHGVPSRVDRLRCLGNAVVPQIVELIGRRIIEHAARQEAG